MEVTTNSFLTLKILDSENLLCIISFLFEGKHILFSFIKLTGDGTLINLNIPSGETVEYDIPDNDITVNGGDLFTIDATEPLDILLLDQNANTINAQSVTHNQNQDHVEIVINTSSFVPVGATLQKTGQTTSYHQDDDGATERGRLVNFFTLPSRSY